MPRELLEECWVLFPVGVRTWAAPEPGPALTGLCEHHGNPAGGAEML